MESLRIMNSIQIGLILVPLLVLVIRYFLAGKFGEDVEIVVSDKVTRVSNKLTGRHFEVHNLISTMMIDEKEVIVAVGGSKDWPASAPDLPENANTVDLVLDDYNSKLWSNFLRYCWFRSLTENNQSTLLGLRAWAQVTNVKVWVTNKKLSHKVLLTLTKTKVIGQVKVTNAVA